MSDWIEDMGFRSEGISDATQAKFDAIKPDIYHLSAVLKAELPRINKVAAVFQELEAEYEQHQKEIQS